MLPFSTRQGASAFNQPLSLDTSSVTDMACMFHVRSARALPSTSTVEASVAACATDPPTPTLPPPCPHVAPPPMLSLVTRQGASAFNQPLSLDTSSVTTWGHVYVRSARALPSASTVEASVLLAPPTHPHPSSRLLARTSPLLLCFPLFTRQDARRSTSR